MADRMGLDFLVSVARWSGFDGPSRFAQEAFETLTYIAGLAAVTNRILVFSTVHVPIVHPLIAAKAMATIDHISGGRGGLKIVMGWNIGRASCRGRECQYVLISGVAGALKKKNKYK